MRARYKGKGGIRRMIGEHFSAWGFYYIVGFFVIFFGYDILYGKPHFSSIYDTPFCKGDIC